MAVDSIFFDDSPLLPSCDILPPDAAVNPPTPTPPVISDCDFETDYCSWHTEAGADSSEQFVWERTTGSAQDNVNGPEENHDGKKDSRKTISNNSLNLVYLGWFVWTAAKKGKPGTSTALVSPIITTQTDTCFKFWFDLLVRFSL